MRQAEAHVDTLLPGYTHLPARAAGAARPPPPGLRLDAGPRPHAPGPRARRHRRVPAGLRGAGGRRASRSTARRGPALGFDAAHPQQPGRRRKPRRPRRLPPLRRPARRAPLAARRRDRDSGPPRSAASSSSTTPSPRGPRCCPRRRTPTPPSSRAPRRRASSADLSGLLGVLHGPAAGLQQGPPGGQGLPVRRRGHPGADAARDDRHDRHRGLPRRPDGRGGIGGGFLAATDLADHLVRLGWPFRRAHEAVGRLVRACLEAGHRPGGRGRARVRRGWPRGASRCRS